MSHHCIASIICLRSSDLLYSMLDHVSYFRSLEENKKALVQSKRRLANAIVNDDEALVWKKSLCDQLQLLVEDSNRGRTQKLIFISENYLL